MEDIYPHNSILTDLINNVCSKTGSDNIGDKSKEDNEAEAKQFESDDKRQYSSTSPDTSYSLVTTSKKPKRAVTEVLNESTAIVISTDSDSSIKGDLPKTTLDDKSMTIVISSDSD